MVPLPKLQELGPCFYFIFQKYIKIKPEGRQVNVSPCHCVTVSSVPLCHCVTVSLCHPLLAPKNRNIGKSEKSEILLIIKCTFWAPMFPDVSNIGRLTPRRSWLPLCHCLPVSLCPCVPVGVDSPCVTVSLCHRVESTHIPPSQLAF